jgi:hypothetical protein
LNIDFERREQLEEEEEEGEEEEEEEGEDNETLNIDDELITTMEDARKSGGHNVAEQSDLILHKFPIDL